MAKGVTVRGIQTVLDNVAKVSIDIERATGKAVRGAAMMVEREAKTRVPVDTGRLRSSIASEERTPLLFEVGTNVEYAAPVEFGTSKMAAQPYLEPAIESARVAFPGLVAQGVKTEL